MTDQDDSQHALVLGGSGMLRDVSLWLAHRMVTSVIARNTERLDQLAACHVNLHGSAVDYTDVDRLHIRLKEVQRMHGPVELVVAWVHGDPTDTLRTVRQSIERASDHSWRLVHVVGSSTDRDAIRRRIDLGSRCTMHSTQLGFVLDGNGARWLTHTEISNGVIRCIETKRDVLVGRLEPWDERPR